MKRFVVAVSVLLLAVWTLLSGAASAATSKSAFDLHIADPLLQQAAGSPPYAIARADNGDTIALQGAGEFDVAAKTASGSGTFTHHVVATDADISGTWTASRLVSFQLYGCGGDGFPPNFCGGLAKLDVTLTPTANPALHFPAILWVDCLIGDKVPPSRAEGIRLNVQEVLNFDQTIESGFTLFIQD